MDVRIDSKAREYIEDKGGILTLKALDIAEGCAGTTPELHVMHERPKQSGFHEMEVDGMEVYVDKRLEIKEAGLKITLGGFGPFKQLHVQGVTFL